MNEHRTRSAREVAGDFTVRVLAISSQERRFVGTAFYIGKRSILTCRHVIEECQENERIVIERATSGDLGHIDWVVNDDPYIDISVGTLPEECEDLTNWADLNQTRPQAWVQPIKCLGYRAVGYGLQEWTESVSAIDHAFRQVVLQNSIHKGCSGGPAFDSEKNLVGVVVSRDSMGVDKHVLPVITFFSWLESTGWRSASNAAKQDPSSWLSKVPLSPHVPLRDVPQEIIEAFAETLFVEEAARSHIERANALIVANKPDGTTDKQVILTRGEQPGFDEPNLFWSIVFSKFGVKSRRSVAALIEAEGAPNPFLFGEAIFSSFRDFLANRT